MKAFDLTSDIHIDHWLRRDFIFEDMVRALLPSGDERSDTLVIAGDIANNIDCVFYFFEEIVKHYKNIVFVVGNHDLWITGSFESENRLRSSAEKFGAIRYYAEKFGVTVLDGTATKIDGVVFAGTGMWYDYQFGIKNFNKTEHEMEQLWGVANNDAIYCKGIDNLSFFREEREKLDRVLDSADVIVTHVGPDASHIPPKHYNPITGMFFFDGEDFLKRANGKVWCYGHTHDRADYTKNGCRLINNAVGYPTETLLIPIKKVLLPTAPLSTIRPHEKEADIDLR